MTKIKEENAPSPFAVVDVDDLKANPIGREILAQLEADGVKFVTREEMRFLKEWSWGPDTYRVTCEACGDVMVFERHPADWPNHPGDPGELRVKIECPVCGNMQFTDGMTEADYKAALTAELTREVSEEVARRLQALNNGEPVVVENVTASESADGTEGASHT